VNVERVFARGVKRTPAELLARRLDVAATHPDVKARLQAHRVGAVLLPDSCDLASFEPERGDQGQTPTCFAHSTGWATATAFAAAGAALGWVPSPRVIAQVATALDRATATPVDAPLPTEDDEGGTIATVVQALSQIGVQPMRAPTPDGRYSDVWCDADTGGTPPGNLNDEPKVSDLVASGQRLIVGPYGVDPTTSTASDTLAACLVSGIPIVVTFYCSTAFQLLQAGQVAGAPATSLPGGGHATYLSGYQPLTAAQAAALGLPAGSRAFWLSNSWGTGWANGGRVLVSAPFIANLWEAWPWDVARLAAKGSR
jgi:hypothetical protein